jgi:hypothetical protein
MESFYPGASPRLMAADAVGVNPVWMKAVWMKAFRMKAFRMKHCFHHGNRFRHGNWLGKLRMSPEVSRVSIPTTGR